ncbi:PAS domain S-box protein [Pedobacter boryungensis]|uniref:PAS domain S-box protein n=1 Tax=Pedobacter boryungensis TaxID=869962 RepID=A0ABX2D9T6_9SPHI|nr:PAS domain S-box protein [Pedobacter boryungensis]NQX30794.1 PAS domain S-box protein [Pedobacter boryungensis]
MNNSEQLRVDTVNKFLKLDFNKSEFQDIVELAAKLCEKPVALITLLDEKSNWLKVRFGTDIEVMPRQTSFCQFGIQQDELLIIPDATKDKRFKNNPLVQGDPHLKFYAGVPLSVGQGINIGTLCLFDQKANKLTDVQQKTLSILARQVTFNIEMQMNSIQLQRQIEETEAKNNSLTKIAQLQSHQIRQPLTTIMGLISLVKNNYTAVNEEWLTMLERATNDFDKTIVEIVAETMCGKDLRAIRFNKMVEEIDDYAILLLDHEGNIENWNKGAEKIKGYKSSEVVGRNFSIFYTDEDKKNGKPRRLITRAAKLGVAHDEGWRLRMDGTKFWGSIIITAIHDETRKVIGFTKVTRDLTEIKAAQDKLKASVEMHDLITEQMGKLARIGGWEFDLMKDSLSWTDITRQIHGVDENYIPQLDSAINFYKEGISRLQISNAMKQAVEEGMPWDLKLQMITFQGKEIHVHAIGRSNYKDGVCTKVYGTFQEITDNS